MIDHCEPSPDPKALSGWTLILGTDPRAAATLAALVFVWYGSHTYSVIETGRVIKEQRETDPMVHVTLTLWQVCMGVVMCVLWVGFERVRGLCDLLYGKDEPGAAPRCAHVAAVVALAGMCQFAGTAGTNASMASVGSTNTQLIKATEPIYTAVLQQLILAKGTPPVSVCALGLIFAGTLVTTRAGSDALELSARLLPSLLACVSLPLMRVVTKTSGLEALRSGADTLLLLSSVSLLPATMIAAAHYTRVGMPPFDMRFVSSAVLFNLYQLASLSVLRRVDAVTHSIGNAAKRVVVITACALVFDQNVGPRRAAGIGVAFFGIALYAEGLSGGLSCKRIVLRSLLLSALPMALLLRRAA